MSGDTGLRARERAAAKAARASGWSLVTKNRAIGGTAFVFQRRNLRATVVVWAQARYSRCLRVEAKDCADVINVVRR